MDLRVCVEVRGVEDRLRLRIDAIAVLADLDDALVRIEGVIGLRNDGIAIEHRGARLI